MAREIRANGVLALECAFRSRLSSFDHGRRGARFFPFALFAFFAIYLLSDDETRLCTLPVRASTSKLILTLQTSTSIVIPLEGRRADEKGQAPLNRGALLLASRVGAPS